MKKILATVLFVILAIGINGQSFNVLDARLRILEEKSGLNQNLKNENINQKRFVSIKDFEDHTERLFISVNGDKATFVEVFDDKTTQESNSNVFSGDVVRTNNNVLSFRFDVLEGEKLAMPITKTLLLTKQKKMLYLIDVNTEERWIDEVLLSKKSK